MEHLVNLQGRHGNWPKVWEHPPVRRRGITTITRAICERIFEVASVGGLPTFCRVDDIERSFGAAAMQVFIGRSPEDRVPNFTRRVYGVPSDEASQPRNMKRAQGVDIRAVGLT